MREAIGGTWLFNIVIVFVLLFTGYMCLSINYSKAFNAKDAIINEIERHGGSITNSDKNDETMKAIRNYLNKIGYRTTGNCDGFDYGINRDGTGVSNPSGSNYLFCLSTIDADQTYLHRKDNEFIFIKYYKVQVFYHLDLPILREMFNFKVTGDTKLLYDIRKANKG